MCANLGGLRLRRWEVQTISRGKIWVPPPPLIDLGVSNQTASEHELLLLFELQVHWAINQAHHFDFAHINTGDGLLVLIRAMTQVLNCNHTSYVNLFHINFMREIYRWECDQKTTSLPPYIYIKRKADKISRVVLNWNEFSQSTNFCNSMRSPNWWIDMLLILWKNLSFTCLITLKWQYIL